MTTHVDQQPTLEAERQPGLTARTCDCPHIQDDPQLSHRKCFSPAPCCLPRRTHSKIARKLGGHLASIHTDWDAGIVAILSCLQWPICASAWIGLTPTGEFGTRIAVDRLRQTESQVSDWTSDSHWRWDDGTPYKQSRFHPLMIIRNHVFSCCGCMWRDTTDHDFSYFPCCRLGCMPAVYNWRCPYVTVDVIERELHLQMLTGDITVFENWHTASDVVIHAKSLLGIEDDDDVQLFLEEHEVVKGTTGETLCKLATETSPQWAAAGGGSTPLVLVVLFTSSPSAETVQLSTV